MNASQRPFLWLLLPWAIGFCLLTFLPFAGSAGLSFARVDARLGSDKITWIGAAHYQNALGVDRRVEPVRGDPWYFRLLGGRPHDPRFYTSLYNSLFYSIFAVPLGLCSSLAVALLLSRRFRGESVVRALVYLPHVLGGVATIVIWSWLFNPQFGWINQAIRLLYGALDPVVRLIHESGTATWPVPRWLHSSAGCKPAVILMHAWTMGGSMLIFLAALRCVPVSLYDAASLDGAGAWPRFRHMTLPQISPVILLVAVVPLVFSMQSFCESYLLANREQGEALLFSVVHLYRTAFEPPYRLGYACALGWILCVVLFLMVAPLILSSRRWVHYEG